MNLIPINTIGSAAVLVRQHLNDWQFLLLKRNTTLEGSWCYVAGKIKEGEKAWQTALRDIQEETGLIPAKCYSADTYEQFYDIEANAFWIAPVFVAFINASSTVNLNHEHSEYCWLSLNDAIKKASFPGYENTFRHIYNHFLIKEPPKWLKINI
jgi:dATP pyrophosphohydrolase